MIEIVAFDGETFATLLSQSLEVMNTSVRQREPIDATITAKGAKKGSAKIVVKHGR